MPKGPMDLLSHLPKPPAQNPQSIVAVWFFKSPDGFFLGGGIKSPRGDFLIPLSTFNSSVDLKMKQCVLLTICSDSNCMKVND